ncbi:beta-1,6-N-acetylglucosaminyltransferase [Massilia sp. Leaf139]|uniref:beta-1,6-N-acetylglucosaminyltransferase n=1 Tax=Massilia sp. Leaf139 TaxID=1736272 RepID=UPI0009E81D5B|nr:beta-1,6-N-acetylglucosaminyltransferase [Massilia sp. Leaf139]
MKQVFLIHAHQDLAQLNALLSRLADPDFVLYVHLDRKWRVDPARVDARARQVLPRLDVRWGAYSQVAATLASLRHVLAHESAFDKLTFLSGQDYPVLSNGALKAALAALRERELIDAVPIGPEGWPAGYRYQYFYREGGTLPLRLACALANRALRLAGRTRSFPAGLRPYGGATWWSLSRPCLHELLVRVDLHPALARFFRSVLCPDELFFQTLIMASPFAGRVAGNYRYVQWPAGGARNPQILVEDDFGRILASGAHFCRKLDGSTSAGLRARLDAWAGEGAGSVNEGLQHPTTPVRP